MPSLLCHRALVIADSMPFDTWLGGLQSVVDILLDRDATFTAMQVRPLPGQGVIPVLHGSSTTVHLCDLRNSCSL
jgi:hypothetical protein